MSQNGFDQYKKLLLTTMEEHTEAIHELIKSVHKLEREMSEFQGRVKVISLFAGLVGGGLMSILVSLIVAFVK